ncbi:hypothetical protein BOTBODRAFT_526934 [Botryobasidium botryosum FD-172 SS1]|uniref:Uncharacterized protein n=1 Tax=Botryobasidium botryosum (strain FD-172 SS1) TaxID=930990 RepID=A0A067M422_BOTB1|nr:hypothetical protein BOTBODRAFT_526934 [Botryobasidium botryosum FD-172 SS1]
MPVLQHRIVGQFAGNSEFTERVCFSTRYTRMHCSQSTGVSSRPHGQHRRRSTRVTNCMANLLDDLEAHTDDTPDKGRYTERAYALAMLNGTAFLVALRASWAVLCTRVVFVDYESKARLVHMDCGVHAICLRQFRRPAHTPMRI